jgi:hypothetical protein
VKADSAHHSVVLENEYVRVLHIHYGAHEKGNMHSHPCSLTVFLTDGNLRMTMPDGKSRVGTVKAVQTVWEDAGNHQPENTSDQPFDAIRTELKNPRTAPDSSWMPHVRQGQRAITNASPSSLPQRKTRHLMSPNMQRILYPPEVRLCKE